MKPWDESGRSVISFVELDTDSPPQAIPISRVAPGHTRFIVEQLLKVVSAAEAEVDALDVQRVARRFGELEQRLETWAQHLSEEEVEPHRARFRVARSRATNGALTAEQTELTEKERLVSELETLVSLADWGSASVRFAELIAQRRPRGGTGGRSGHADLDRRLLAAERAALARQAEAKRLAAKVARVAEKQRIIAELESLGMTTDWRVADRRYKDIRNRWKRTGHFKEVEEASLSEAFRSAEAAFVAARDQELVAAARERDARAREARIAAKTLLIADLQALAPTTDWPVADIQYRELKKRWIAAGHFDGQGEANLSDAFAAADSVYVVARNEALAAAERAREIREVEERRATQERVVAEAEALARAPYWDAVGFEKLSHRWKASGPPFDPSLWRRFQDAYLIARGAGFKDAIRVRIEITTEVGRLSSLTEWPERARRFSEVTEQWATAALVGPDIEVPLQTRYAKAVDAFLDECDLTELECSIARVEHARLTHAAGDLAKSHALDAELRLLCRLAAAVLQSRTPIVGSPTEP